MRSKRFRNRKRSVNTRLFGVVSMVLLVLSVFIYFGANKVLPLQAMAVLSLVALLFGNHLDKKKNGYFYVDKDELVIRNTTTRRSIQLLHVKDASIVDPNAARGYIQGRLEGADNVLSASKRLHLYTQFCTIELGLMSRFQRVLKLFQTRLSTKSNDLILLRLSDGTDVLLSPIHAQDAVAYLSKALATTKRKFEEKTLFNT